MSDLLDRPLLENEVRVEAADVVFGMYVVALDIPWEASRFIFKGFLIEDEKELNEIRKVCQYVVVDRTRSVNVTFDTKTPKLPEKNKPVAQADLVQQFLVDEAKSGKPVSTSPKLGVSEKTVKPAEVVAKAPPKPIGTLAAALHAPDTAASRGNRSDDNVSAPVKARLFRTFISPLVDMITGIPKIKANFNPNKVHQSRKHFNTALKEDVQRMQFAKDIRQEFEFSNSQISDKMTNYVTTASLVQEVPVAKVAQYHLLDAAQSTLAMDMNDSSLHEPDANDVHEHH